jgi:hypothetical protein
MTNFWPVIGGWGVGLILLGIGVRAWHSVHGTS